MSENAQVAYNANDSKVEGKREKTGGRQAGTLNKTTAEIRELLTRFGYNNAHKLGRWLARIEEEEGASKALDAYIKVVSLALPRLASVEVNATIAKADITALLAARERIVAGLQHSNECLAHNVDYVKQLPDSNVASAPLTIDQYQAQVTEQVGQALADAYDDPAAFEPGDDE
jgi:hypothetical protein